MVDRDLRSWQLDIIQVPFGSDVGRWSVNIGLGPFFAECKLLGTE